ncbi:MAG: type IV toxin-antitoxin system AbiEi family antitoxin domain-containing protein [Actinobacteria bacterium]|nr:type IV toxin-antitoxin system AbiEi family antitoxin domain-containing protein [Actinomycetota bacterium]
MARTLASLRRGVLRPRDAAGLYTQPALQFRRLEQKGVLLKVAHGYYAHIPEASRGGPWRPEIEALALGVGQADYGVNGAVLMHLSAARVQGAIPRAIAVAVLAVPKQRPTLETTCGRIVFVKRDVARLKRIKVTTELATGWSTSNEQTTLDLARRPDLITGLSNVAQEAAGLLVARCNEERLAELVREQRMGAALVRVKDRMAGS